MRKYVDDFIDIGPGRPFYPGGIHINYYKPAKKQVGILREDMFRIDYGDDELNYVIDVGWYGQSFSPKGLFRTVLIKDGDWQKPIISIRCKSVKRLVAIIKLCLTRLKKDTDNFNLLPAILSFEEFSKDWPVIYPK